MGFSIDLGRHLFKVAIALVLLGGCGGALSDGKSEFRKGRYAEAKRTLVRIELESRRWDDKRRAEYALYRGLTEGALGDRAAAGVWLKEAKAMEDASPGSLSADDLSRLRVALDSIAPDTQPDGP